MHVIWRRLLFTTLVTSLLALIYYANQEYHFFSGELPTIDFVLFSLIGIAISLYIGFSNNACYERWWEGRKLWGSQVNYTRTFARQILTLIRAPVTNPLENIIDEVKAFQKDLVYRTIALTYALKMFLRSETNFETQIGSLLPESEINTLTREKHVPNAITQTIAEKLNLAIDRGWTNHFYNTVMHNSLTEFTNVFGACERIFKTPFPIPYRILAHRLVVAYCLSLPFAVVPVWGFFSPFIMLFVSYVYFALAAIADELRDPFGIDFNDLALNAICRTIEINLRQRLGETDLPEAAKADHDGLLN